MLLRKAFHQPSKHVLLGLRIILPSAIDPKSGSSIKLPAKA
jgi:hypothetical protein